MGVTHPPPAPSTVKSLYATARICAHPECSRPLFQENRETNQWTLNSRICHINARREGGPRWDAQQTARENRSEANLLLLCPEHASLIDDVKTRDLYPADTLKSWKSGQVDDFRQRMVGWDLTPDMAKGALEASFQDVEIAINATNVILGGKGGSAPGAGGGGGGAIGKNSQGGQGGNGGKTFLDLPASGPIEIPPDTFADFFNDPDFDSHSPHGSGGGGAGAVGDNEVGGDGGDGGDIVYGFFEVEPGDQIEFEVGQGGVSSSLPGVHGQDGGDSLLHIKAADGKLKRTIRAKGGTGKKLGAIPDGMAEITDTDLAGDFCVTTLLLANAIELQNGLLYMLGSGWDNFTVPTFPFDQICPFVCIVNWNQLSDRQNRGLQLCVTGPDGKETSRILLTLPVESLADTAHSYKWISQIGVPFHCEGIWTFHLQSGGHLLSKIALTVQAAKQT